MENRTPKDGGADAQERLEKARAVYAWTFRALQASLKKLEAEEDTATDSKNRHALFHAHVKQLQTVYELEGSLDTVGTRHGAGGLDLAAARLEIGQRLARIRDRRSD